LFDPKYDIVTNERRQAHHTAFLAEIKDKSEAVQKQMSTDTGWRLPPSPVAGIVFDGPRQTPPEAMHLLLENLSKPLTLGLYRLLPELGQSIVDGRFPELHYPRGMPKIAFPFNSKLPERFGMSQVLCLNSPWLPDCILQFFTLLVISPHLFKDLIDNELLQILLQFCELVFLALTPHMTEAICDRVEELAIALLPALGNLKKEHNVKLGGPSSHSLLHLAQHMRRYAGTRNFWAQRDEARHRVAKRDVLFTQKRQLVKGLMRKEAIRIGLRYAYHGGRWNDRLLPDPHGQFVAGPEFRNRMDVHTPGLPHPLFRLGGLSHYMRNSAAEDDRWMFPGTLARLAPKQPLVVLSAENLRSMTEVYSAQHADVELKSMPNSASPAKSATVGDQTYQAGDDLVVKCVDDTDREYEWYAQIHRILVHQPAGRAAAGKRAVWFECKYYQECFTMVRSQKRPLTGTINRKICALDDKITLLSARVVIRPVAVFHYCKLSGADKKAVKERKAVQKDGKDAKHADDDGDVKMDAPARGPPPAPARVSKKLEFKSPELLESYGDCCGLHQVMLCRAHKLVNCPVPHCAVISVPRYVHGQRNLWAIESNWHGR